ncbi:MAG: cytochrome C oxidase subunit IV family protein [Anaerolineae bacterium]|nr:cytochrome C oxidase subunit IV family protein [Anaerolineae bacterium]MDW8173346.1 cytochrome C oxidase subunit IV family protein [Anaerolineae bacterium]
MSEHTPTLESAHKAQDQAHSHDHHSDTVTMPLLGTVTVYGGIYTVVFGALAVLTALEVLIAELLKTEYEGLTGAMRIAALLGIGIIKSLLVIWFYMHLGKDNRILRFIIGVPLIVVLLAILYLMAVPTGPGGGYF